MACIIVPRKVPRLPSPERYVRNGIKPYHVTPMRVGQMANFITCRARKIAYANANPWSSFGVTGDTDSDWFAFHSGYGASGSLRLRIVAVCAPNTKFDLNVTPNGGSEVTETFEVPASARTQLSIVRGAIDIDPNTLHTGYITTYDTFLQPYSLTVFEEHDGSLATADSTTIDTRKFANKLPVFDGPHQRMVTHLHNLYTTNGRSLLTLHGTWTRTGSTAVNMLDGSSTSVTSATPGFNWNLSNLAPLHDSTTVNAVMRVYGNRAAGVGTNQVQLHDSSGSVATVSLGTTLGWYANTAVSLTPGEKHDVYVKSDSVNLVTVRSVMIYLMDV
jgi:hypothetical protein